MSALPFPAHGRPAHRATPRPQLRLVTPPPRTARWLAALVVVTALAVVGVVSLHALAAEAAFDAVTLSAEVDALEVRYDELTAEVARLESPERVRHVAIEQLGMVPAADQEYLALDTAPPAAAADPGPPGDVAAAAPAPGR